MDRREFAKTLALASLGAAILPRLPDVGRPVEDDWSVIGDILEFEVEAPFKWTQKVFTAHRSMTVRGVNVWTYDRKHTSQTVFREPVYLAAGDSFSIHFKWQPSEV